MLCSLFISDINTVIAAAFTTIAVSTTETDDIKGSAVSECILLHGIVIKQPIIEMQCSQVWRNICGLTQAMGDNA